MTDSTDSGELRGEPVPGGPGDGVGDTDDAVDGPTSLQVRVALLLMITTPFALIGLVYLVLR